MEETMNNLWLRVGYLRFRGIKSQIFDRRNILFLKDILARLAGIEPAAC